MSAVWWLIFIFYGAFALFYEGCILRFMWTSRLAEKHSLLDWILVVVLAFCFSPAVFLLFCAALFHGFYQFAKSFFATGSSCFVALG